MSQMNQQPCVESLNTFTLRKFFQQVFLPRKIQQNRHWPNASRCWTVINCFEEYAEPDLPVRDITLATLPDFDSWLRFRDHSDGTVAEYIKLMRMILRMAHPELFRREQPKAQPLDGPTSLITQPRLHEAYFALLARAFEFQYGPDRMGRIGRVVLTGEELSILRLLRDGFTIGQATAEMGINLGRGSAASAIRKKLSAATNTAAVVQAIRLGFISSGSAANMKGGKA